MRVIGAAVVLSVLETTQRYPDEPDQQCLYGVLCNLVVAGALVVPRVYDLIRSIARTCGGLSVYITFFFVSLRSWFRERN